MADTILIIDFGSQVTQLIARRLRETGVYTEILPCTTLADDREVEELGANLLSKAARTAGRVQPDSMQCLPRTGQLRGAQLFYRPSRVRACRVSAPRARIADIVQR